MSQQDTILDDCINALLMDEDPDFLDSQDQRGQQKICEGKLLPIQMTAELRDDLKRAGVVFGAPVADDSLFIHITLPDRWRIVSHADHVHWSYLIDDQHNPHATIFYRASFFDRKAFTAKL